MHMKPLHSVTSYEVTSKRLYLALRMAKLGKTEREMYRCTDRTDSITSTADGGGNKANFLQGFLHIHVEFFGL